MITMLTNPALTDLSSLINRGTRYISSVLIVLMLIILFMISQGTSGENFQFCLHCDDLNRESKVNCATRYEDCGHCKTGFIQDETDTRVCYAVEILEDPGLDIVQSLGSAVILTCIFNSKVLCVWTKNTIPVDIISGSTYHYLSPDAGTTKKSCDCSIRIEYLLMNDVGQWQCQSMADDNMNSVKGGVTQISIEHDEDKLIPTIMLNNGNVNYQEIDMDELLVSTRLRRQSVGQRNMLECQVTLMPWELRWEVDGKAIFGSKSNDSLIHLDGDHLLQAIETRTNSTIQLTCLVKYEGDQILTSYVIIRVGDKSHSNEQSRLKPRLTQSSALDELPDVVLQETLSYNANFNVKAILISIIALFIIIMVIVIIVTIIIIVIKMKGCHNAFSWKI